VTILTLGLLMVLYAAKRIYSGMTHAPREDPIIGLEPEDEPTDGD